MNIWQQRGRPLTKFSEFPPGPVVYWMSRDQRALDNWALLAAQELAQQQGGFLAVVFCLQPTFGQATLRQFSFMLDGLQELERTLDSHRIPFFLLMGKPEEVLLEFLKKSNASTLITDFSPLKLSQKWKQAVAEKLQIPFLEIDAHNIIPCWLASDKEEYAARTFHPKVHRLLDTYLHEFPTLQKMTKKFPVEPKNDWNKALSFLEVDESVTPVSWLKSGEQDAEKVLEQFIKERLPQYDTQRNDPNAHGQSELSPYLHFGQISAQRVALEVQQAKAAATDKEAFLEELIVRRELSDNFCFYNPYYDSVQGAKNWAQKSLTEHEHDPREHRYSLNELEQAQTHDPLWNAAQTEMNKRGKMHGYLRMYWAKKILEWSPNAETAYKHAIYLNDKYFLDGRDPNGYVGVLWSIAGVHDRAWFEHEIFGKIRYMNFNGAKRKFDVDAYVAWAESL